MNTKIADKRSHKKKNFRGFYFPILIIVYTVVYDWLLIWREVCLYLQTVAKHVN